MKTEIEQISQLMTETSREGLTEAALNRYNADKPSLYSFPASQSTYVASEVSTGTSVAASFFARVSGVDDTCYVNIRSLR
ncbi:hypothetical protein WISP_112243 [Willisornis vidua]|uniref:Uncharacterized protein n=1 Tax=Willisornis vidua TaxID=1566151 RepID=A0ABQ9CZW8_9PASS|nr:hypothetical protein WISP_112243 [Willisornis vidua]